MPDATRVHRLLQIMTLIRGSDGWTPERLAAEFGVTERTIYRDLQVLGSIGVPVEFDRAANQYRIDGDVFLPPLQLTPDEALALVVLCEKVAASDQIAFTRPAHRALTKIQGVLPHALREEVRQIGDRILVQTAPATPPDGHQHVYERVREAIASRRALRCRYQSLNPATGEDRFDFEPYALFFSVRAWYAVGYHSERDEVRTLKLKRFVEATPTQRDYSIPESFSLESHIGNAWRMIRGDDDHEVEIWFDAEFAETMSDTRWHPTQTVERHADGSATFRCVVSGLGEIVWWVLSMGPHCRVVRPAALADRVREAAAATARLYG